MVVWGVDVSTKLVAIAVVTEGSFFVREIDVKGDPGQRLGNAYMKIAAEAGELAETHPPVYVLVEQPSGARPSPELSYMVGAATAGIVNGCAWKFVRPAIATEPPPRWKKALGIGGNADKDRIMAWARGIGYEGGSQDAADALGIAHVAWARARRDVAKGTPV